MPTTTQKNGPKNKSQQKSSAGKQSKTDKVNNETNSDSKQTFKTKGEDLVKKIKQIVKEGNAKRIILKDDKGNVLMEIPVTIGVIGTLLLPVLAAVGALAAMVGWVTVELVQSGKKKK